MHTLMSTLFFWCGFNAIAIGALVQAHDRLTVSVAFYCSRPTPDNQ
jgi:hypothetical protein